jgi:phosphoribosylaminoimidazole-succinocarboxamide synthase
VNILPGMVSHYWWQGAVERGEEVVMIIKTRGSLAEHVGIAVKEMHSYTTPAILIIPIESTTRAISTGSWPRRIQKRRVDVCRCRVDPRAGRSGRRRA